MQRSYVAGLRTNTEITGTALIRRTVALIASLGLDQACSRFRGCTGALSRVVKKSVTLPNGSELRTTTTFLTSGATGARTCFRNTLRRAVFSNCTSDLAGRCILCSYSASFACKLPFFIFFVCTR